MFTLHGFYKEHLIMALKDVISHIENSNTEIIDDEITGFISLENPYKKYEQNGMLIKYPSDEKNIKIDIEFKTRPKI